MRKIAFLGAGAISEALISGMIEKNIIAGHEIVIKNRSNQLRLIELERKYGVVTTLNESELLKDTTLLFLTVKPKDVKEALESIKHYLHGNVLIVSVAAGVSISSIQQILKNDNPIVRAMPNTSAQVNESATAIAHDSRVTKQQLLFVQQLFHTVGKTYIVDEKHLDGVTALAGSGPAYIYYFAEAMLEAGEKIGLGEDFSKELIIQTLKGAAKMMEQSEKSWKQLRKDVTSPNGTTEAGVKILDQNHVQEAISECIQKANERSKQLGEQLQQFIIHAK